VKAKRRDPDATPPRVEIQVADPDLAAELRLDAGGTVVSRHQQYRIDGTPWSLQTSFYPLNLVERGATRLIAANDIKEGAVEYLRETVGIKQVGYRDTITVRAPDGTEARFFGLADDGRVSVIETRRTAFDNDGMPVRLTISVYPADRNQLAVNVGRVPEELADPPYAEPDQPTVTPEGGD
jgi:GntR family transcriptional regulator